MSGLQNRWTQLEAIVGTDKRLDLVARDIVEHYEERLEAMEGKAMIVCMSRRICVDLYNKIIASSVPNGTATTTTRARSKS